MLSPCWETAFIPRGLTSIVMSFGVETAFPLSDTVAQEVVRACHLRRYQLRCKSHPLLMTSIHCLAVAPYSVPVSPLSMGSTTGLVKRGVNAGGAPELAGVAQAWSLW